MDSKVIKTWSVRVNSISRVNELEKNVLNPLQSVELGTGKQFPNEQFVCMSCLYKPASSCSNLRLDRMYDLVLINPNINIDTEPLEIDLDNAIWDLKDLIDQDNREPIDHDAFVSQLTDIYQNLRSTQEDVEHRLGSTVYYGC